MELMAAVDSYIPQPDRPKDQPFPMPIEDVFSISGRGTVVLVGLKEVLSTSVKKSKLLVSKILQKQLVLVLKCSENFWIRVKQGIMLVYF